MSDQEAMLKNLCKLQIGGKDKHLCKLQIRGRDKHTQSSNNILHAGWQIE